MITTSKQGVKRKQTILLLALLLGTGDVTIMYEPVEGHFITKIGNRFYDIRGDVTNLYRGKPMYNMDELAYEDSSHYRHLMRDCRDFEEVEDDA